MLAASLGLLLSALLGGEDAELKTEDNVKIAATYTKPEGPGKHAAFLLVHVLGGKKEDWGDFPAAAAKAGYAVLAIDMRGHGKSENPLAKDRQKRDIAKWEKDEWMMVLKDIKAAKAFLAAKAEVDAKKIVVMGASIGGNLALHYAVEDTEVKAVAALSPGENYKGVSAPDAMDKYDRPFFAAASEDDAYSAASMKRLMGRAKHRIKNAITYQAAGHGTKMFGAEDKPGNLTTEIFDWAKAATR